ncbi:MAG: DUF4783 domain-containing protein [Cytophagales bacterium]|nr:DUF4783 domain-containing protein [Cytophagales bacterium]
MKKSRNIILFFVLVLGMFGYHTSLAQNEIFSELRLAIQAGDSEAISKYLDSKVDLKIESQEATYSSTQAKFVLKDFFQKYPSKGFSYIHKGESPGGAKYAIGSYTCENITFRVYMKLKKVGSVYRIDTLDFTRE